jgi:hypothetical protein
MRITPLAIVATFVFWHALLQGVPHHHADTAVPQERMTCSASRPLSQEFHLHSAGEALDVHSCLACSAGSTAEFSDQADDAAHVPDLRASAEVGQPDCRSLHRAHLPLHRGPPAAS